MSAYTTALRNPEVAVQPIERRSADRRRSPDMGEETWRWQNLLLNGNERRSTQRRSARSDADD